MITTKESNNSPEIDPKLKKIYEKPEKNQSNDPKEMY